VVAGTGTGVNGSLGRDARMPPGLEGAFVDGRDADRPGARRPWRSGPGTDVSLGSSQRSPDFRQTAMLGSVAVEPAGVVPGRLRGRLPGASAPCPAGTLSDEVDQGESRALPPFCSAAPFVISRDGCVQIRPIWRLFGRRTRPLMYENGASDPSACAIEHDDAATSSLPITR